MPFYFKFRHFDRHENSTDVILCLHKMKRTDWLLCLAKNCDWFKFKIQKIQKNLNRALSSSLRLSSNRSWARTNQNARITWVIIVCIIVLVYLLLSLHPIQQGSH